mmetsp:Transcript_29581/g.48822  ORF Transcript_29581/g.48822 Transcript_29581/m.48822 type:complete len:92 (+) Transcript_29581:90-365(+)
MAGLRAEGEPRAPDMDCSTMDMELVQPDPDPGLSTGETDKLASKTGRCIFSTGSLLGVPLVAAGGKGPAGFAAAHLALSPGVGPAAVTRDK